MALPEMARPGMSLGILLLLTVCVAAPAHATDVSDLLQQVDALNRAGKLHLAEATLEKARRMGSLSPRDQFLLRWQEARLLSKQGDLSRSRSTLADLLSVAGRATDIARLKNDLGTVSSRLDEFDEALTHFNTAYAEATQLGLSGLAARSALNAFRTELDIGRPVDFNARIAELQSLVADVRSGAEATDANLALGQLIRRAQIEHSLPAQYRVSAYESLRVAATAARAAQRPTVESLALGYIGLLYEQDGRDDDAMAFATRALALGKNQPVAIRSYEWLWLTARIASRRGEMQQALTAYEAAVSQLESLQSDLQVGSRHVYRDVIAPIFYQYTELLLNHSAESGTPQGRQNALAQARDLLEQLKVVEIRDYFQSDCLPLAPRKTDISALGELDKTGILYSIVLDASVELLLYIDGELSYVSHAIDRTVLEAIVAQFLVQVRVDTGTNQYLDVGANLYDALIAPVDEQLRRNDIETLIFVPDRLIRPVPFSALIDSEQQFVVERFATGVVAGVGMVDPSPLEFTADLSIVSGGLTIARQHDGRSFSALPHVLDELDYLEQQLSAVRIPESNFVVNEIREQLAGDFQIAHFATHGSFGRSYEDSFILAADGVVTLNDLAESIATRQPDADPLELLVLSACETASGDASEQAALGLAGVSIRAGARSAFGSLWAINDSATAELIEDFYEELRRGVSKAEALRLAQLKLIQRGRAHPSVWAPYLIIGNWR